ncbi:GtrA family protein [Pedobacter sp. SYP-B3415]|uniref:GtrA family protein n=1 Tax=Pedobacter sp. SYP-B3415 TaxID=2496641 RepID=UPI00101C22AE|nr:GtrA family protein [Pedobacter sp. SYP-B3415]
MKKLSRIYKYRPEKAGIILFLKAQVAALAGGLSDYAIMILLVDYARIHLSLAIFLSGTVGALINFYINRRWVFLSANAAAPQLTRFIAMILGSITLKASATWLLTNFLKVDYKFIRIGVDLLVSYSFNYPLIRFWVFSAKSA